MRAYIAFGPSLDDPHGHGGFLSTRNGARLTYGPLTYGGASGFLKRMNQDGSMLETMQTAKVHPQVLPSETRADAEGGDIITRLLLAVEKQLNISKERA